jgi:hypothetical protein
MIVAGDTKTYIEKVKKAAAAVIRSLTGKPEVTDEEMKAAGELARTLEREAELLAISIEFEVRNPKHVVKV